MSENSELQRVLKDIRSKLDQLEAELEPAVQETPEDEPPFNIRNLTPGEAKAMLRAWFNENNRTRFGREHKGAGWVVRKDRWALAQQAGFRSYAEAGDYLDGSHV